MIMKNIVAHFDISPKGNYCDGYLSLENGVITKHLDGAEEKFNIAKKMLGKKYYIKDENIE